MNDLKKHQEERVWVEQTIQLLRDIARAGLSDLPKLPENISIRAIPLAKKAKSIQEEGNSQSGAWVEQVISLLSELSRISLSDRPKLPDFVSQKALDLAKQGQKIKETAAFEPTESTTFEPTKSTTFEPTESTTFEPTESTPTEEQQTAIRDGQLQSPGLLLDLLQKSLKIEWAKSNRPDVPEWQQLINLLDIAKGLYQRIE